MTTPKDHTATQGASESSEPDACPRCNGEGTVRSHTSHLGPDDYDFDEQCPSCAGTGSADLRDAINALGFWTHKTDIQRTLIERSAVLSVIDARAALAQRQSAPADPQAPFDAEAWLREWADYWRKRALDYEDAYKNLREWAQENGLDTRTYGGKK